jgi:hypothetical protein
MIAFCILYEKSGHPEKRRKAFLHLQVGELGVLCLRFVLPLLRLCLQLSQLLLRPSTTPSGVIKARRRQGKAGQGKARQGKARQGKARQGKARQGKARQGKTSVDRLPVAMP